MGMLVLRRWRDVQIRVRGSTVYQKLEPSNPPPPLPPSPSPFGVPLHIEALAPELRLELARSVAGSAACCVVLE